MTQAAGPSGRNTSAARAPLRADTPRAVGTITIGNSAPVFWDDSGTIVVGQNVHTTHLIVSRVTNLVQNGTLNENGGTLSVPEAGSFASALAAALTPALVRRRLARTARS